MLRSFLLLTTPCFLTVFTLVVVWASTPTSPPPPLHLLNGLFTLFSIVQAWVPFSKTNCHHPLYSNICLYNCTSVPLYFCTSVRPYVYTSVHLHDSPSGMSAGSTEFSSISPPTEFLHSLYSTCWSNHPLAWLQYRV